MKRYRKNLKKERFKRRGKRIKRKNKKAVWRRRWFWDLVLGATLAGAMVYALFFWEMFQVEEVGIKAKNPSDRNIVWQATEQARRENLWFVLPRSSIFLIDTKAIKEQVLAQNLAIERLDINKQLPRQLQITVNLRQPIFLFCQGTSRVCFLMDKTGFLFQKHDPTSTTFLTTVTKAKEEDKARLAGNLPDGSQGRAWAIGERPLESQEIEALSEIKARAEKDIGLKVMGFAVEDKDITMETGSGWKAYFALDKDIAWQVLELNLVLDDEIGEGREGLEYIDLRFNKVYYKYK